MLGIAYDASTTPTDQLGFLTYQILISHHHKDAFWLVFPLIGVALLHQTRSHLIRFKCIETQLIGGYVKLEFGNFGQASSNIFFLLFQMAIQPLFTLIHFVYVDRFYTLLLYNLIIILYIQLILLYICVIYTFDMYCLVKLQVHLHFPTNE